MACFFAAGRQPEWFKRGRHLWEDGNRGDQNQLNQISLLFLGPKTKTAALRHEGFAMSRQESAIGTNKAAEQKHKPRM